MLNKTLASKVWCSDALIQDIDKKLLQCWNDVFKNKSFLKNIHTCIELKS